MRRRTRYRVEDGRWCIDLRLRTARQLFDLRDPAPFRDRDLDPGAAEHIMACLQEIPARRPVKIVLFIVEPDGAEPAIDPAVLKDAIRGHFQHERDLADDAIRDNFKQGRRMVLLGLVILGLFLTLSKVSEELLAGAGHLHEIVREGFVITGWVAMWRPAEVLLYDWWPLYEKRRWIDKLLASATEVRGAGRSVLPAVAERQPPTVGAP